MEIIDDSEKKKVLKKFSIVENQLPKILVTDPSIQALKANAGDIVSINREDLTGKYTVYKLVV
ncbi:DNA-directed RNA polymerase subunit H [Candidatus Micrarchaeota archaeon]|nr:DNA-directed RNA polymerase subunit H [Candidatus Micrarchaeota archaeon]